MAILGRRSVVAGLSLLVGACHSYGKDFVRPDTSSLVLGQTTVAEAIVKIGPPTSQSVQHNLNPANSLPAYESKESGFKQSSLTGTVHLLSYSYLYTESPGVIVGPSSTNSRRLALLFWNDRLSSYSFESSFEADSTNFDEAKLGQFVSGQTTRSDVVKELGRPTGESIYLTGAKKGMRTLTYVSYRRETKGWIAGARETSISRKTARLVFDSSDKLVEQTLQTGFTGT